LKILVVCSGLDFINYTRKATIEAIQEKNPELEILMYNSVLNLLKKKNITSQIKFHFHHFWVVEKVRVFRPFVIFEHFTRSFRWKRFFEQFEVIFLIDPNQYYLLSYISSKNKLIYLLRDPSVLQGKKNYSRELPIIRRANAILGISENLCSYYFLKYYEFIPENVHLWSNTVDLRLWNYDRWKNYIKENKRPKIGLAGNINYVTDLGLLNYLAKKLPQYDFEIAGKIELSNSENNQMKELLLLPNVTHLGFIPFNEFPSIVINWDVGIVAAKTDHEYAKYLNNNKQFQYLAFGKPFVSFRFNADYSAFEDFVFLADDKFDFAEKIKSAIHFAENKSIIPRAIKIASEQSSQQRANQFLEIIRNL
jgi:hypothetical protein